MVNMTTIYGDDWGMVYESYTHIIGVKNVKMYQEFGGKMMEINAAEINTPLG